MGEIIGVFPKVEVLNLGTRGKSWPSLWQDAWLHKESVLLWDRGGTMYHIRLKVLLKALKKTVSIEVATFAIFALFRNDWKDSAVFHELTSLGPVADALTRIADEFHRAVVIEVQPAI